MAGAHEHLEHAEHIAHAGHDGNLGRNIGVTMAAMGVLLAFSSAMVGGERMEFVAAMIARTNASGQYQSISTKYRVVQAQLQALHSVSPNETEFKKIEAQLAKLEGEAKATNDVHVVEMLTAMRLERQTLLQTLTPAREDLLRFVELVKQFGKEREHALLLTESFEDEIEIHEKACEHYEYASLLAEVGIVIASIALLLQSRGAWFTAIGLGVVGIAILMATGWDTHHHLAAAEKKIHDAAHAYAKLSSEAAEEEADDALVADATAEPGAPPAPKVHREKPRGGAHGEEEHGKKPAHDEKSHDEHGK